jgi:hypothetical protein
MKKSPDKTTESEIISAFLKHTSKSQIVACYIYSSSRRNHLHINPKEDNMESFSPDDKPDPMKVTFEYFNKESFLDFINNRKKIYDGILQKYVDCYGAYQSIMLSSNIQSRMGKVNMRR